MLSLNLPPFHPKIELREGKRFIFDILRRQYVALTPEEWVRQHFIHYLVEHKVLYDRNLSAKMILEYKAPHVPVTQQVFDQIGRYNLVLRVDYLVVSNGLTHYCCKMDYERRSYTFLQGIPDYASL